ncbi:glycosyltransferase [Aliamphritea spongicola]|nr:glycosyltransferase [Aliamphritea spongicola]
MVFKKPESKKKNLHRKVLCYVGEGKEEFYGINEILEVSNKLPHFEFVIIGSTCSDYKDSFNDNVTCLGWVESVKELMEKCGIYLRITEHDGLPFSVIEALSNSMYVVYNRPFPHCRLAKSSDEIVKELTILDDRIEVVGENSMGRDFVSERFTYSACASNIIKILDA